MKKLFVKFSMLLFLLWMSVNAAWGQSTPTYWLTSLRAERDANSLGTGDVKLNLLDVQGYPMENPQFINPQLNITNTTEFGETAQLVGFTVQNPAMPQEYPLNRGIAWFGSSFDPQLYMTGYAYFYPEAQPVAGSYLAEWTYDQGGAISLEGTMGGYGLTAGKQHAYWTSKKNAFAYPENGEECGGDLCPIYSPEKAPCFKVLPNSSHTKTMTGNNQTDGYNLFVLKSQVEAAPNIIKALFAKYTFDNASAQGVNVEAVEGNSVIVNVTVEVVGDATALDMADFATFTFSNDASDWSYDLATAIANKEVISAPEAVPSAQRTRLVIPVTYTVPANVVYGVKNTTMTLKITGENSIDVSVSLNVNALDPNPAEAFLFDGETPMETEKTTLAELMSVDVSGYTNPILKLNQNFDQVLAFSDKNITLNLNGNTVNGVSVSGGEVKIAFSQFGGNGGALSVTGGKVILNGGTFSTLSVANGAIVEQNGATFSGAAINHGTLTTSEGAFNSGLTSDGSLTINNGTFNGETAIIISGGNAAINRGRITGSVCGLLVQSGAATVKKLAAITGTIYSAQCTGGSLVVECGKFNGPLNGTIDFTSGFFTSTNYGVSTEGLTEMLISAGVEYGEGYRHYLGTKENAIQNGAGVCRIGTTSYATLEDAIAYANNNPSVPSIVIFMTNDYTLPAGYYTLPANATIIVPMSDTQTEVNMAAPRVVFNDVNSATPYVEPSEFRRLTFANGVNMDVFGKIELTCSQYASNEAYTSQPVGPYGRLVMEEGSHMTLQDGSELRAWGFMTGKGETDARRGAKVREMFQMGDWKGAMTSVRITGMVKQDEVSEALWNQVKSDDSGYKIFPVTQYFIQNVESPVKYHPGAVLSASAAVSEGLSMLSISMAATDIAVVGVSGQHQAIFLMDQMADAENTWVRKWYDVENDVQVYDINSAAHIGSMVLDMGVVDLGPTMGKVVIRLNSAHFDLPITSNMKIHLLSGTMDFQQNTNLLPGAEVEVDKESTVTVAKDENDIEHTGALYVYDAANWDKYAYCNVYDGSKMVKGTAYVKTVRYSPSWNGRPTKRAEQTCPQDAAINVHGTFMTATGFVYCSEQGANIFSNNVDAGTFVFNEDAVEAGTRTVYQVKGSGTYESCTFYPAKLKNGVAEPEYANTNEAKAGDAYCYTNNVWNIFKVSEDNSCFMVDNYGTYYAKPQEYVAVVGTKTQVGTDEDTSEAIYAIVGNADHTYSDADGAGRLFILMPDACQWWEVEKKGNLYHCIHPNNDTYYYWDEDSELWAEKRYTITWKNWDGTEIISYDHSGGEDNLAPIDYSVTYGTMAEFLGTNPTREATIDYTYDFAGWTPALGPVTSDVTYTATYTQKPRMYTIIFQNEGGVEIERQFLTHNEVPVCENVPTKVGHTLEWSPAIAAVTGDATYRAIWHENPPTEYEVTFFDYNGEDILQQSNVAVGDMPTPPADPTGKPATSEFTYVFDHWSPALEEVSATSIKSYTAVYAEVAKTYTIKFVKENGNPDDPADIIESHQYQYGETPICANTPTKDADAQYTFALRWEPQIQTVMEDATYTAVFDETLNKYTVSVMSNPSGACAISGAGIYDYNASNNAVTITITPNTGYTFTGWSDGQGGTSTTRLMAVTGDINLVANFTVSDPDYTITWKSEDGSANLVDPVGQKAGTATIYTGAIPTKPATAQYTYTFDGWTTSPNGAGTFYKNNMTPKATANATYYAHFAATEVIIEVGLGQAQNIAEETTVNQLILNSNGTVSGQLTGDLNNLLNVTGVCYYDLTGTFTAGKWYAVAVPWQVTARDIRANGNTLSLMSGDYLAYYDGSVRAAQGKVDACWKYLSNSDVLVPGRLYMLYLQNDASVLRFPKKSGTPILTSETSVSTYGSDEPTNANWNGIANPAIFYAYLSNTGASVGQVFNATAQSYEPVALSTKLIVAKPIFVQATNSGLAPAVTTPPAPAPVRRNAASEAPKAEYQVEIASYGRMQDRLFIQMNEDKEADTYTLGQDVVKFGVSNTVAQMWVNRYDAKLCMNTVNSVNNVAEFPLSIFAPRAGEYQISNVQSQMSNEAYTLYLTYNGEAIWNLSESDYVLQLEKGTTANYGLRISARKTPTGIDEAVVDAQGNIRKVLVNDKVFIIRGEKVYTIDGQLVK